MITRWLRSLVLLCSLILALPPGWCCILAGMTTPAGTTVPVCQGCCCLPDGAKKAQNTPSPAPVSPFKDCCCADHHSTTPSGPAKVLLDLSLSAVLPPADSSAGPIGRAEEAVVSAHFSDPPVYLLHCVWLC